MTYPELNATLTALAVFIAALLTPKCVFSEELNQFEQAVWDLEHTYYEYVKNNDPQGYLTLFHQETIGWPALEAAPRGKDETSAWIASVHSNPAATWDFDISLKDIESFGDVVVVHYLLSESVRDADSGVLLTSNTYRIAHTWKRVGKRWLIISGMGGRMNAAPRG